jgi:tetratricopeptide (TPR) repeat protein
MKRWWLRSSRWWPNALLRAYAREQALAHDGQDARDAAVRRVLDDYLHTAHSAAMLMEPHFDPLTLSPLQPGVIPGQPAAAQEAADWFSAEHAGLEAARRTHDAGRGGARAARSRSRVRRSGRFADAYPCFNDALTLFAEVGDQVSQARIHSSLTWLAEREQRLTDALDHGRRAFDLLAAAGHAGQAMILNDLGYCHARLGQYQQALSYCERALGHHP